MSAFMGGRLGQRMSECGRESAVPGRLGGFVAVTDRRFPAASPNLSPILSSSGEATRGGYGPDARCLLHRDGRPRCKLQGRLPRPDAIVQILLAGTASRGPH